MAIASVCVSLVVLLFAFSSCGGDGPTAQLQADAYKPNASGPLDILTPDEMFSTLGGDKGTSAMTLYREGSDHFSSVYQRITDSGSDATFTPAYAGNWSPFDTVAFAAYRLQLAGYTGSSIVNIGWTTPPPSISNAWVGLSEWNKNRWVWFPCPEDGSLELTGGHIPYIKPGLTVDMLVTVVVLGNDSATLHEVWFGGEYPVHTLSGRVTATSGQGIPGVTVGFSNGLSAVTTDNNGAFTKSGVYNGSYTLTPTKTGLTFTPSYRTVTMAGADIAGIDFATGSAQGDWWMFGRDRMHRRLSTLTGPPSSSIKWQYNTGAAVNSSPALAQDGTVYFGALDNKLYALNIDGSVKWTYAVGDTIWSSPAVGVDGTVYFGSLDNCVYALNSDGTFLWSRPTTGDIYSSPCIGQDGTIYVGSYDDKLYALDLDGTVKWSYATGGDIASSPAQGPDGAVYVGSADGKLYAINTDGTLKWTYTTGAEITFSSPSIGLDGSVYIGSYDNKLYAITPEGTLGWAYTSGDKIWGSPAVGSDNSIYFGSMDGSIYALDASGALKWSYPTGAAVYASPTIGSDGTVYCGSYSGSLYALTSAGALKWEYVAGSAFTSSPVIAGDGAVYSGCGNGRMYAIGTGGSTYVISGYVKDGQGSGVEGVTISFDGLTPVTTDATGLWQQTNVPNGNYTATPSKQGYTFDPAERDFVVASGNVTVGDFTANPISASGYVKLGTGQGIAGVTMTFSNGLPAVTTDANGHWTYGPIPDGTYSVTPSKTGYTFDPASRNFTMAGANVTVPDFTGDCNIASGYVLDGDGKGIANVSMTFTGGLAAVTTNASGYWIRDVIPDGTYTVTPTKNGYTFNPANRNFTINNNDIVLGDFQGTGGAVIEILTVTTDKTTHKSDASEDSAQLNVTTDPSPADTYTWSGPGDFSATNIANPTWKPNGSTPLGKVTLTIDVTLGAAYDSATIDLYVTTEAIQGSYTGLDGVTRQVGDPAGSGTMPDFDLSPLQYLTPLIDGGTITTYNGMFSEFTAGKVVLFDRWELW